MAQEPDIKCWTAKCKAELIKQIYRGQTTVPEAARPYDLIQQGLSTISGLGVQNPPGHYIFANSLGFISLYVSWP